VVICALSPAASVSGSYIDARSKDLLYLEDSGKRYPDHHSLGWLDMRNIPEKSVPLISDSYPADTDAGSLTSVVSFVTRPYSVGSITTLPCRMRRPSPLVEVGGGIPLVEVGGGIPLVALDCPTFFLLDDPRVVVVGGCVIVAR